MDTIDWKIAYTQLAIEVTNIQELLNDFAQESIRRMDLTTTKRLINILMATQRLTSIAVQELELSK